MPCKIAVIGCGHWGPHHLRIFNSLSESVVTAVADSDPKRLESVRKLYPDIRCETDGRALCGARDVEAVVIATPTNTHFELVKEALNAGKHVLCEKPLCVTSREGEELVKLAADKRLILMVGHVFLFNAGILKVKEMLDAGELGKLQYMSATRTNLGPIRSDVNVAYDLATHDISIFNWLLGGVPESVSATGGKYLQPGIMDLVFVSMRYPDGRLAFVQASWLNPKKTRQITFVGSKKMVTWDDLELTTPVSIYDRGAEAMPASNEWGEYLRISMWDGDVRLPKIKHSEPLKAQDLSFLEAVRTGKIDRSGGDFALGAVRVLEAINKSLEVGGAPIKVGDSAAS